MAPGEIVNFYGSYLGPATAVSAAGGITVGSDLAGVQVFFDDLPAPVVEAQAQQIQAVVSDEIAGKKRVTVTVQYAGQSSNPAVVAVMDAVPGLFTIDPFQKMIVTGGFEAAALNQDGSSNFANNPAAPESVVTLFATGGGQMVPQATDGEIEAAGAIPVLPVTAYIASFPGATGSRWRSPMPEAPQDSSPAPCR
ncbi:MAG TPA: hypothetical protein VMH81_19450 [Bryobacteraceae bacterium]|nr:hypothetical protein [Bryobacteraceae bacterium]